jgi:hypothetical protein
MANSKAKNFLLGNLLVLLGLACAIVAIFMPYAEGLHGTGTTFGSSLDGGPGYDYIFGDGALGVATAGWVLILIGTVFAFLIVPIAYLTKNGLRIGKFTFGQVLGAGAALLLLVGGILYFFVAMAYRNAIGSTASSLVSVKLGVGFLLAGIFAIASSVFCCLPLFVTMKK